MVYQVRTGHRGQTVYVLGWLESGGLAAWVLVSSLGRDRSPVTGLLGNNKIYKKPYLG